MFLILSQREKRQKELERKKKEKEARENKERLEVRGGPHIFGQNAILTPSQKEERQRGLEREKEEKEAKEHKEKIEVRVTLPLLVGCHANPTAEGKETKGIRT